MPRHGQDWCAVPRWWPCAALGPISGGSSHRRASPTTDGTIAVVGTGTLDADAVRSLMQRLPQGTWELVTHPGYNDADLGRIRTRLRASRDVERTALLALREFPALDLISFAQM